MNNIKIETVLENIETAARIHRKKAVETVMQNLNLFEDLVHTTFQVENKLSIKAAWVLEWICTHENLDLILAYLDKFTSNIITLKFDSAIRPCAKICEHLATAYTSKTNNLTKQKLNQKHIDAIIETGFDWLITPQKIAVRAYTMNTLFLFGLNKDWIHLELKHLIQTKIIHESKGCKARGKHILELIEKHEKRHK